MLLDPKEYSDMAKLRVPAGLDTGQWIDHYNRIYAQLLFDACVQRLTLHGYDDAADEIRKWAFND